MSKSKEEYSPEKEMEFLANVENSHNCSECPYNNDFELWPGNRLPCGRFHCWVDIQNEEES